MVSEIFVPQTLIFFFCSNPGGVRSPGDEAKRPREVGGGLDLSFRREEEDMVSEGEVGKEEEERREEEGVRVGQDEEGRETESDDGTPRPNGGTSQVNEN